MAAALAALFVVGTVVYRMQGAKVPKIGVRKLPLQVDVALEKVHYTEVKEGVKRWDLSAQRAEYNKQTDVSSLYGVRFVVAGGASTGDLTVTAERADYRNATRDVTLIGNVRGQSTKGISFSTPRITFVAAKSQLETAERVRFADAGLELEGVGMEFHTQSRRLKLLKDVSAVYRPQGGR